ncbi:MAG: serine protease [Candidatus Obscuribacterales bacterium]|jgi:S1-C subfamily serine protease|nr:serine protease [Candidatus Obscuribacterales bacterium]
MSAGKDYTEESRKLEPSGSLSSESKPTNFDALAILRDVSPGVVKIRTPNDAQGDWSVGTGFMVSSGDKSACEIASLTHVTGNNEKIQVTTNNGQTHDAFLVKNDLKRELSVFKIPSLAADSTHCKPLDVSSRELKSTELVLGVSAVADPRWPVPYLGISLGQVSRDNPVYVRRLPTMIGEDMLRPMGAFVMRGDHGDSGGPIVDAARRVVGIEAASANGYSLSELSVFLRDLLNDIAADRKAKSN